jgi:hypothetical protein
MRDPGQLPQLSSTSPPSLKVQRYFKHHIVMIPVAYFTNFIIFNKVFYYKHIINYKSFLPNYVP